MKTFYSFILIGFCIFPHILFAFAYPYERMEIVKVLEKEDHSLKIKILTPLEEKNRIFAPSYWKVYYEKNEIVGEELFEKGLLTYYYVYYYTKDKITQKGFFWFGIERKISSQKLDRHSIKGGFFYKNIPDSYKVYDRTTLKQIFSYITPNKEI